MRAQQPYQRHRGFDRRTLLKAGMAVGGLAALARTDITPAANGLAVLTTTGHIADAARVLGEDQLTVDALMGPGVDPHLYAASEGDLLRMLDADLILYHGLNLEGRLGDVFEQLRREKTIVAVADSLSRDGLLADPDYPDEADPHVWFDPQLWSLVVQRIADVIVEDLPDAEDIVTANLERYQAEIAALDAEVEEQIASIPELQRVLITAHDAFSYFGRRYGIEVVGIQGISTDTEAGVRDLQAVANLIAEREIPAIFVETSVSPATVEAVQAAVRDRGFDVVIGGELYSDALGEPDTPEGTYLGMFRANVETIVAALNTAAE